MCPSFSSSLAIISFTWVLTGPKAKNLFFSSLEWARSTVLCSPKYFCHHWVKQQKYWNKTSCLKYKIWLLKCSWAPFFICSLLQIIRLLFAASHRLFSIFLSDRSRKSSFYFFFVVASPLSLVLLWSALSSDQSPCTGELLLSYHLLGIHSWKIALSWEVAISLFLGAPFKWMIKVYQPALLALCSVQNFFLSLLWILGQSGGKKNGREGKNALQFRGSVCQKAILQGNKAHSLQHQTVWTLPNKSKRQWRYFSVGCLLTV